MFGRRQRSAMSRFEALRGLPIFAGVPDSVLARVDARMVEIRLEAGATLMRENEPGREACILGEGIAAVSVGGVMVGSAAAGDLVGEIALLDNGPRTATVVALTPLRVYVLDPQQFTELFDDPRSARWIAATLAHRLRASSTPQHSIPAAPLTR
jgi:CRP-like cAMP-binding protein